MGNQHKDAIHFAQLSSVLHAAEVRTEQPVDDQECPLCKIKPGRSRRNFVTHVGRHMESIALAVLPYDSGEDSDDESVTSASDWVDIVDGGDPFLYVPPSCQQDSSSSKFTYESEVLNKKLFHKNRRFGTAYTVLHGPGNAVLLTQYYVDKDQEKFPGGIFWIDGGSGKKLKLEWERMARQLLRLSAMTATSNLQMKELRIWFESRHDWVIIFNGMKGFNEVDQYSFRDFLPKSPESSLIFIMGESDDLSHITRMILQRHGISAPHGNEHAPGIPRGELCRLCGTSFNDIHSLKEHMLVHYEGLPERCPMVDCEYYWKRFARKYDKHRHFLTHFDETIVCNFCREQPDGIVSVFSRVNAFKLHLRTTHGVEQCCNRSQPGSKLSSSSKGAKCSICAILTVNPQALYDHLDDCIYDFLSKDPNYDPQAIDSQRWSSERSMLTDRPGGSPAIEVAAPPLERLEEPSSLDAALETACHASFEEPSNTLLVSNVPREANEQDLQRLFSPYGEIESIHIGGNNSNGLHRVFAYIRFSRVESAVTAFELLDGELVFDHRLVIRYVRGDTRLESPELGDKITNERENRSESHTVLPQPNEPPTAINLVDPGIQESRKVLEPVEKETLNPYTKMRTIEAV